MARRKKESIIKKALKKIAPKKIKKKETKKKEETKVAKRTYFRAPISIYALQIKTPLGNEYMFFRNRWTIVRNKEDIEFFKKAGYEVKTE